MRMLLAAAALMLAPAAAHADDAAPTAETATARLNLDTPVETIVADPAGKAALDANLPGLTTHQHYEHLKGMSLRMIASMAPDQLTAEMLAKAEASLAAIK
ncbi:hypothetical protein [Altererythrobacter sp. TH136]|uniref:hypothetical protein n=1 Tax=Altererythrobacter sp. TH136 TaxID=2067415 RepID=UPI00116306F3|nr:hypothetical protein [Altererythrobacter sp. TH136]QDM41047.1 hypothetical protein C0V74_08395 [Altererythrobacter sp. TH136]